MSNEPNYATTQADLIISNTERPYFAAQAIATDPRLTMEGKIERFKSAFSGDVVVGAPGAKLQDIDWEYVVREQMPEDEVPPQPYPFTNRTGKILNDLKVLRRDLRDAQGFDAECGRVGYIVDHLEDLLETVQNLEGVE